MPRRQVRTAIAYAVMVASAGALFLLVRNVGETLAPPVGALQAPHPVAHPHSNDVLWHLLLALTAVVVVGRTLGLAFRRIGQPPVIGEVIGGVLLGPSLLGWIAPEAFRFILPPSVVPFLGIVSQLGVVFYMFLVGLELNPTALRGQVHTTVATSHASIVLPFVLGSVLALYLYPRFAPVDVPFTSFALFVGIAMSITAFPVLARILSDLGITRTELGVMALTCAAVDDVTAWCLLAVVVGFVEATGSGVGAVGLTLAYITMMFVMVRPMIAKAVEASGDAEPSAGIIALVLIGLLLSSLATEAIGVHALFGAFLLGAVVPHESRLAKALHRSLAHLITIVLLPAFFAFAGMRTEIGLLAGTQAWLAFGLIVLVATVGKFGGTLVAARATGLGWRHAAALGALMNTRGLMQLIVLNEGLELGVITPTLFTMMVMMALVTTLATTPALRLLMPRLSAPTRVATEIRI